MNKTPGKPEQALVFRLLAVGVVLYWLYGIVSSYFQGGADAPSLTLVIVAVVVLGGGAALIGVLAWRAWKAERAAAAEEPEELEEAPAEEE